MGFELFKKGVNWFTCIVWVQNVTGIVIDHRIDVNAQARSKTTWSAYKLLDKLPVLYENSNI